MTQKWNVHVYLICQESHMFYNCFNELDKLYHHVLWPCSLRSLDGTECCEIMFRDNHKFWHIDISPSLQKTNISSFVCVRGDTFFFENPILLNDFAWSFVMPRQIKDCDLYSNDEFLHCPLHMPWWGCHDARSGSVFAMPPFTRALCGAVKAWCQRCVLELDILHVAYLNL